MENVTGATPAPSSKSESVYKNIDQFITESTTVLNNAQSAAILPLMGKRGYTQATMQAKVTALQLLRSKNEAQEKEYGEQYNATIAYKTAQQTLHEDYIDHITLARIAFKRNIGALTALGLRGRRADSQSGYAAQGLLFYDNALASTDFTGVLAGKGVMVSDLKNGQAKFSSLQKLSDVQQRETGEAQQATQQRNAAYDELADWMSDFRETAKVALRKTPQLREQLGIKEVS